MRFIENGPNIPDELLEARDKGEVIFICGAGISIPAGLPSFAALAKGVVSDLGVSKGHRAHLLLDRALNSDEDDYTPPMDQVFNLLKKDYGALVQQAVFKRLSMPKGASLIHHKTILALSADVNGSPRLITTNFDLLFEGARKRIKKYVAPELPDFTAVQKFEGIVYLHGRLPTKGSTILGESSVILSSSDFGRAYLSQGWAARFIRDLLQRYTVVLLGYSATDPPIRYLLEGLETSSFDYRHRIFTFDSGTPKEVDARWRDRNVRGIAYTNKDEKHEALWKSLHAWADRAKDPSEWRKSIIELSKKGPANLSAFERGQVVSLVSSSEGAKAFAEEANSPPPEWICVFDYNLRYAEPFKGSEFGEKKPPFDPLAVFGLDNDPPRPDKDESKNKKQDAQQRGIDVLAALPNEEVRLGRKRISNISPRQSDQLPPRLFYLLRWIAKHTPSPTIAWWAGRQRSLHSEAINQIKWQLRDANINVLPTVRLAWDWLIEVFDGRDEDAFEHHSFELKAKLNRSGWSPSFIRDLGLFLTPRLTTKSSIFSTPAPDFPKDEDLRIRDIVWLGVSFPTWNGEIPNVPDDHLASVFRLARSGLERASSLMKEVSQYQSHTPTFYPEDKPGDIYHDDDDIFFLWIGKLFDRLSKVNPDIAGSDFSQWPKEDKYHFDKLKLYALAIKEVFQPEFVANHLLTINREIFWQSDHRRELLILLQRRWLDLNDSDKESIIKRILEGPETWKNEAEDDYRRRKAQGPLAILGWLQENGCDLPKFVEPSVIELQRDVPDWKSTWTKFAADSFEGRTSWVGENTDFEPLTSVNLAEVVDLSKKHSKRPFSEFTEYRPFKGLLLAQPFRAVSALTYESRQKSFPVEFWREAISSWPDNTSARLRLFFAQHLSRLPHDTFNELRHYIPSWARKYLPELAKQNQKLVIEIWDRILDTFIQLGPEATQSGIGESSIGGKKVERSRRTFFFSHGPIGELAETLFAILNDLKLPKSAGIPEALKTRIEKLWTVPGEGADQALSNTGIRLLWLDYLDPNWAERKLVPLFSMGNPSAEPMWSGFMFQNNFPRKDLFRQLRPDFIKLSTKLDEWNWGDEDERKYGSFVVVACYWNLSNDSYLNWEVTRQILKDIDDDGRQQAIHTVSDIVAKPDGWNKFGKQFFKKAWPQEVSFQTSGTSYALVALAEKAYDHFPDVVKSIIEFVYPMEHPDMFIFKMKKGNEEEGTQLATRFPRDVLALADRIIPTDQQYPPYDLSNVINMIADAEPDIRQDMRWLRLRRLADVG